MLKFMHYHRSSVLYSMSGHSHNDADAIHVFSVNMLLKKTYMYLLVVMIKNILNYANQEKQEKEFFCHFKIIFAVKLYGVINP